MQMPVIAHTGFERRIQIVLGLHAAHHAFAARAMGMDSNQQRPLAERTGDALQPDLGPGQSQYRQLHRHNLNPGRHTRQPLPERTPARHPPPPSGSTRTGRATPPPPPTSPEHRRSMGCMPAHRYAPTAAAHGPAPPPSMRPSGASTVSKRSPDSPSRPSSTSRPPPSKSASTRVHRRSRRPNSAAIMADTVLAPSPPLTAVTATRLARNVAVAQRRRTNAPRRGQRTATPRLGPSGAAPARRRPWSCPAGCAAVMWFLMWCSYDD